MMARQIDKPMPMLTGLRRVERLEDALEVGGVDARSGILYRKKDTISSPVLAVLNQQLPGPVVDGAHRVRCVPEKVQNDLLQLDAITQ